MHICNGCSEPLRFAGRRGEEEDDVSDLWGGVVDTGIPLIHT